MASLDPRERRTDSDTRDALDTAAQRAAEKATRRTARRAAGGYFLLILFLLLGAGAYQVNTNRKLDAANDRLERAELGACQRLQGQRERSNVSEARQFLLLDAIAKSPRASTQVKTEYGRLSRTTLYAPPTDCPEAVARPLSYERPEDRRYAEMPKQFAEAVVTAADEGRPQPVPAE